MKTPKKKFKKNLFLLLILFMGFGKVMQAQISSPHQVKNNLSCPVKIVYEIAKPNCQICTTGSAIIPAMSLVNLGTSCGSIFDIHIVVTEIGGVGIDQPAVGVGDPNTCITSPGTSHSGTCTGACHFYTIVYTPSATMIN